VLSHYLSGYTAAESFYAGTRYLGWEGVCVCDPLCSPYKGSKVVTPTMAAQFTTSSPGVNTEQCSESGLDLCSISDGNYASYKSANFTNENQLITRIASGASGNGPVSWTMPGTSDRRLAKVGHGDLPSD
jgi:hypothetical protein